MLVKILNLLFPVLIVIASVLGIGTALKQTGLAEVLANSVIDKTSGFGVVALAARMEKTKICPMKGLLIKMGVRTAA